MPRVPSVTGRRVSTAQLPGVMQTAAPTAESMGKGLFDVASRIGASKFAELEQRARDREDEAVLLSRDKQLSDFDLSLRGPQGAFETTKGEAALGLTEKVLGDFDTMAGELEAGLNERQRPSFERLRAQRREAIARSADQVASREYEAFTKAEGAAAIENTRQLAIASADDPDRLKVELERVELQAASLRLGPQQTEELVGKVRSSIHLGVLDRMLAQGNDRTAKAYFAEHGEAILGDDRAKVERALAEGSTRGESQRQADAILSSTETLTEALEKARAIDDPEVRDATEDRVRRGYADRAAIAQQAHEERLIGAYNLLDERPDTNRIPPGVWTSFSGAERSALKSYAKAKSEKGEVETNWNVYYMLASNEEILKGADLLGYRHKLSDTEFKQLTSMQASLRGKKDTKGEEYLASEAMQRQMVDDAMLQLGIDPNPPQPGTKGYEQAKTERVVEFRRRVRDAVSALEKRQQKKATDEQVQGVVDTLSAPAGSRVTDGWFRDTVTPVQVFETPNAHVVRASDVPAGERAAITAALQRARIPVTDAAIVRLFNQRIGQVRGPR